MITAAQVEEIGSLVAAQSVCESTVAKLRESYPSMHFTYCMEDDVCGANPVYQNDRFNLYLIDSRSHCLAVTEENEIATGIVLAEIDDMS